MRDRYFVMLVLFSGLCLFPGNRVLAQQAIDSIPQIRRLTAEQAAEHRPVVLEGHVMRAMPWERNFFIFADNEGIFVRRHISSEDSKKGVYYQMKQPKVGDWVRVRGVTAPGEFSPDIEAESVEILDNRALPEARVYQLKDLYDSTSDCDWVQVKGQVTSAELLTSFKVKYILLTLELHDSISVGVQIPFSEADQKLLSGIMFRRVQFNALLGTVYNKQRQMTGRIFLANSIKDFKLQSEDEPSGKLPLLPMDSLMSAGVNPYEPVRTRGVVTYADAQEIFLRGERSSLKVAVAKDQHLQPGQRVELEGFVWPQPISPAFRARTVRVLDGQGSAPEPKTLVVKELLGTGRVEDLLDSRMNYELVKVKAQLVEMGKTFGLTSDLPNDYGLQSMLCRSGGRLFEARLPEGMELGGRLQPGALLELTGICNLIENKRIFTRLYFDGLWMQIREASDVVVVQAAPWWTLKRMIWIAGITLGIALLFLGWVAALHKTVDRQTRIISQKIERETILDERQRIARELHDNLEQGLAGMAIQLRGCQRLLEINASRFLATIRRIMGLSEPRPEELKNLFSDQLSEVEEDTKKAQDALKVVQGMLTFCSEESRSSILDLRGGLLERMDFSSALREVLTPLAEECGAQLSFVIDGTPRRLKQVAERNLLLMVKEAASNAARHGAPDHIRVNLTYGHEFLSLSIVDDGSGFLVDRLGPFGRFGLQGMHERINQLNGEISIESKPGEGTAVRVKIPSTAEWELS